MQAKPQLCFLAHVDLLGSLVCKKKVLQGQVLFCPQSLEIPKSGIIQYSLKKRLQHLQHSHYQAMERDRSLARIPSNIHAPRPRAVTSCMQHCWVRQQNLLQLLGNWERAEEKNPKPKPNHPKATASSKPPNSGKGERQLRFSLKAFLKQVEEPRVLKGF